MISAVLFDLDETLLDRTTSLVAFLAEQHARFAHALGVVPFRVWRDRFLELDERGLVSKSVVYSKILTEFSGDLEAADALLTDYKERCCRHAKAFPGMTETLLSLRSLGAKLAIVTNGETDFQMRHINALGLMNRLDAVLISQTEGLRKPDPTFFYRAAARVGVEASLCLFVGDNPETDILGAHAVGMQTAWFRCGAVWPDRLAPMPGSAIDVLPQVLDLVRIREN